MGGAHTVPVLAELTVAAAVIVLLLTTSVLTVVGFSSFGVLVYYSVTNAAAFTLAARPWHAPRWLNVLGFLGCLLLAVTLPPASVLGMAAVLAVGVAGRVRGAAAGCGAGSRPLGRRSAGVGRLGLEDRGRAGRPRPEPRWRDRRRAVRRSGCP